MFRYLLLISFLISGVAKSADFTLDKFNIEIQSNFLGEELLLFGKKESEKSNILAKNTFKENSSGENLPAIKVTNDVLKKNIVELISFINKDISKSEIRRLIKSNAIKIDNKNIHDEKYIVNNSLFSEKGYVKLSIGKKKHFKITN